MRAILDTSAYLAFVRNHPAVVARVRALEQIYLTPIVLGELYFCFLGSHRRDDNERNLQRFLSSHRARVLPIRQDTARRFAVIFHDLRTRGVSLPANDMWIAASAMEWGLELLTTDAHFLKIPQIVVQHIPVVP